MKERVTTVKAPGGFATARALVVDDDPLACALARRALHRVGIADVESAASAAEAFELLRALEFHLLLCDLEMPGEDGIELLHRLQQAGFEGAIVIFSGHDAALIATAERVARNLGLTVLGALTKPLDLARLAEVLAQGAARPLPRRDAPVELPPDRVAAAFAEGRLTVHYQPIVTTDGGRLDGVETLVRLRPEDERSGAALISPDRFVGVAERSGLGDVLLDALLDQVAQDLPRLRRAAPDLRLSINLAPCNLDRRTLPQLLAERFAAAGVPPNQISFEVTESDLVSSHPARLEVLARLRLKGFGLSIDDFGTGYSTIAQLRDVPFTSLKVDRGFVSDVDRLPVARSILEYSVKLARELGLKVVAEGVERVEELEVVRTAGADLAQGYLFSRPLPVEALLDWIASSAATSASTAAKASSA